MESRKVYFLAQLNKNTSFYEASIDSRDDSIFSFLHVLASAMQRDGR